MTDRLAERAGAVLAIAALVLLVGAPVGVMLSQAVVEMAVCAIAGVGLALLHLAVVLAVHMRALARVRSTHHIVSVGGGGGGGRGGSGAGGSGSVGPVAGGGAGGGAGNAGRPPQ